MTLQERFSFCSRTFFTTLQDDHTDSITSLSPKLPNPLSSSLAAHTVEIDNSESAWEAEAARAESLMSLPLLPCTGSSAKVRLFYRWFSQALSLATMVMWTVGCLQVSLNGTEECWSWQGSASCFSPSQTHSCTCVCGSWGRGSR